MSTCSADLLDTIKHYHEIESFQIIAALEKLVARQRHYSSVCQRVAYTVSDPQSGVPLRPNLFVFDYYTKQGIKVVFKSFTDTTAPGGHSKVSFKYVLTWPGFHKKNLVQVDLTSVK